MKRFTTHQILMNEQIAFFYDDGYSEIILTFRDQVFFVGQYSTRIFQIFIINPLLSPHPPPHQLFKFHVITVFYYQKFIQFVINYGKISDISSNYILILISDNGRQAADFVLQLIHTMALANSAHTRFTRIIHSEGKMHL